ncbi:unnamed protein product [Caenorhabditis bovis]|uniref:Serpentine Receptor, class E (Epsilon) n=1 Tax=Caenorhabditis bovis TaxID=2654633 RepID=A0A8S1EW86_9PELO|nr:unnamed protein product [Caenorhabditis bovis]
MIVKVSDCDCTLWLPVFALHFPQTALFYSLTVAELILSLISCSLLVRTIRAIFSSFVFHKNLNLVLIWTIAMWIESLVFKIVYVFYSTGIVEVGMSANQTNSWYSEDDLMFPTIIPNSTLLPLHIACILRWHYFYSLASQMFFFAVERCCATYFILDYEQKNRIYIFYSIFIASNAFSLPMSFLTYYTYIRFTAAFSYIAIPNIAAFVMIICSYIVNKRIMKKFGEGADNYTLAMRFQAHENIKAMKLIRQIIFCGFIFVILGLSCIFLMVLNIFPSINVAIVVLFEIIAHQNMLILCPVFLMAVNKWRDKPAEKMSRSIHQDQNEIEVYFKQLKTAWK